MSSSVKFWKKLGMELTESTRESSTRSLKEGEGEGVITVG